MFNRNLTIHEVVYNPLPWIFQDSEYAIIMKMRLDLHMMGFWIFQDSKYARVLNMPRLHRILNVLEYTWICLNDDRIYVNILDYLLIYFENVWINLKVLNKPKVKHI